MKAGLLAACRGHINVEREGRLPLQQGAVKHSNTVEAQVQH